LVAEEDASVRAPLFDRLVEDATGTSRTLDRDGLLESVRREIERLFNTRSSLPAHELAARARTVIDYGVPDFSHLSTRNPEDRATLIASLTQAIEAYEPRLRAVRIAVDEGSLEDRTLKVRVAAELVVDPVGESLSFECVLPMKRGNAIVYGSD